MPYRLCLKDLKKIVTTHGEANREDGVDAGMIFEVTGSEIELLGCASEDGDASIHHPDS